MKAEGNLHTDAEMFAVKGEGTKEGMVRSIAMSAGANFRSGFVEGALHCLGSTILALTLLSTILGCAGAATITVCESGCDSSSIKSALNQSMAGDVIEVRGGTYTENLDIQKSVSLVGLPDGDWMPEIKGSGHSSVVVINIDNVNISGFKLTNSGNCSCGDSGLRIRSNNNTAYGNNITGNYYGVYAKIGSKDNRIFANSFINNSVNIRDSGENQWYGTAPPPGGILSTILGYLGAGDKEQLIGNYYDDYDEEEEGCKAEDGICSLPYNITVENNITINEDPYPLASPRV